MNNTVEVMIPMTIDRKTKVIEKEVGINIRGIKGAFPGLYSIKFSIDDTYKYE